MIYRSCGIPNANIRARRQLSVVEVWRRSASVSQRSLRLGFRPHSPPQGGRVRRIRADGGVETDAGAAAVWLLCWLAIRRSIREAFAPHRVMHVVDFCRGRRAGAFGFERAMDSVAGWSLIGLGLVAWAALKRERSFSYQLYPTLATLMILAVRERRSDIVAGSSNIRMSLKGATREYRRLLIVVGGSGWLIQLTRF